MKRAVLSTLAATLLGVATLWATEAKTPAEPLSPFEEIQKIQQEMDAIFNRLHQRLLNDASFSALQGSFIKTPAADLVDKGDHYLIEADIPGADAKSIKVSEKNGMLKIEASSEKAETKKTDTYIRQERFAGAFVKIMTLPKDADASKLKTEYKNGVLKITIPKKSS